MPDTRQYPTRKMENGRRRTPFLFFFAAALGLVLVGCAANGVPSGVSATVNGIQITDAEVEELTIGSEDDVSTDGEEYRNLLTNSIVTTAMVSTAQARLGLEDLSTREASDAFLSQASQQDIELIGRVASNPELTEHAVDLVIVQLNVRETVKRKLATETEFLQDVWQNDQNLLMQVCARHVLVATEEEAITARDRFEAGEDFSDLATELSLDTQSPGGALPCPSRPDDFLQPFSSVVATAPVGVVAGPVETQFGWHIVLVDSREFPQSLDELAEDPLRWLPPSIIDSAWIGWINEALEASDIVVRSQIGTWYPAVDGIIPPAPSP
jgi:parvulin-like peptidyl-prolyl isomerase